jgi:hypothetical protein
MTTTSSIAELQSAGVKLETAEAVAIAQQLIKSLHDGGAPDDLEPPYGPPTAATVVVDADGSVSCAGCGSKPAISEIAIFLDALLPAGSPRVPGGLRYTIARALLEVDVEPFDSLDAFSAALARYERGDRAEVVRRLVRRSESACVAATLAAADRRRSRASATDLRRALREADAKLYAHQNARLVQAAPQPATRTVPAIAACIGAGLMLIAAGEFMQRGEAPRPAPVAIVAPAADAVRARELTDRSAVAAPVAMLGSTADARAMASSAPGPARGAERVQRGSRERAERVSTPRRARMPAVKKTRAERSGVLDRLKLGWLKTKIVIRADAL